MSNVAELPGRHNFNVRSSLIAAVRVPIFHQVKPVYSRLSDHPP
jgi:hypothetical protein